MSSLSSRLGSALSGLDEDLPRRIHALLVPDPSNVNIIQHIVAHLGKSNLKDGVLANCVLAALESIVAVVTNSAVDNTSDVSTSRYSEEALNKAFVLGIPDDLMKAIVQVVSLLYRRRTEARQAAHICRCMARIMSQQPTKEQITYVVHILSNVCKKDADVPAEKCAYSQECALWFLWFCLLQPKFAGSLNVGVVDAHLAHWNMLSCTLLREWSSGLPPMKRCMATRLTCQLIRLASSCQLDTFRVLSSLKFPSDLHGVITCLGQRDLEGGLKAAQEASVVKEYGAILDYLSNVLVVRIEHGKKNLLQLADTTLALVRCLLAISEQPLDQALLLLRHVVYNRSVLNEEELPRLLKALCTLREHLPFNDPKHSVWKNEALAKVANNIANALKNCKEADQAQKLEETFVLIMCTLLPRFPESKDCLQLLRVVLMGIEIATSISPKNASSRLEPYLSPRCIGAVLELYGPDKVDPLVLVACETSLRKQDVFLFNQLSKMEPNRFKWLALELYALQRIGASKEVMDTVLAELRACRVKDQRLVDIITVISLRAKAQHHGDEVVDSVRTESSNESILIKGARKGIWLSVRLRQLSEKIKSEIDRSQKLLHEPKSSSHENSEAFDRRELLDDMPLALQTLRYSNYVDLFQSLMWIFANYQELKTFDYWMLLATAIWDDLKLAAGFLAINGDTSNHFRILTITDVLLKATSAPKSVILENRLRIAEALVQARCVELAETVLIKIDNQIQAGIMLDCEDFFHLRYRLEMLRLWVKAEECGQEPPSPDRIEDLAKSVRVATIDKLRIYGLNRYYHGTALNRWGIIESGKRTAIDILESTSRNMKMCLEYLETRNPTVMTWEKLDVAFPMLSTECVKADALFDLGSMRETINVTTTSCSDGQVLFSLYFTLRHIERMLRIAIFFDRPIESKMKIVSDILDVKGDPLTKLSAQTVDEEPFKIKSSSTIPYHTAMYLKMRQIQDAKAERRMPAKEFVKFHKRQRHPTTCKCYLCYSLGIHVTLKKLDAITAHVTLEKYSCSEQCAETRLAKTLRVIMQTLSLDPPPEEILSLRAIGQKVKLRHAFSLSHGYALMGKYSEALLILSDAHSALQQAGTRHDRLEMELLKFEYSFNVNWSTALAHLGICTNEPVQLVPEPNYSLKTPAATKRPIVRAAPPRRRLPFSNETSIDAGEQSKAKSDVPKKKARVACLSKKTTAAVVNTDIEPEPETVSTNNETDDFEVTSSTSASYGTQGNSVIPTRKTRKQEAEDRPKFKPLDENSSRVTRTRRKIPVPRSHELAAPTTGIDDIICDDDLGLEDQFIKISLAERFNKSLEMDGDRAEKCFQTLIDAARPCMPVGKQVLLTNLFTNLAFLSAWRGHKDYFQFYLEKSLGVSVQLAGLNRGLKMVGHYEDGLLDSSYFDWLRPTVEFEERWYEKLWKWCDPGWSIVQVTAAFERAVTPSLIATRYQKGCDPQTVHINSNLDGQFQRAFIKEFEDIIVKNQISLKLVEKSKYWKLRESADRRLYEFFESLENQWMGCWKGMFLGKLKDETTQKFVLNLASMVKKWASKRKVKVDNELLITGLTALPLLSLEQLVTMLYRVIKPSLNSVEELQTLAADIQNQVRESQLLTKSSKRLPVILVLDRHLINMPFDSCHMYHDHDVTRMPCVGLVAAQAQLQRVRNAALSPAEAFTLADPYAGFYCINPGDDLPESERRFREDMSVLIKRWEGTLGKPMEREDFKRMLRSKSVYLYCGHGTGRQHMREQMENINIRAAALIMGCSSGRMRIVGQKMDTEGYALRLVLGGSPAVLGNLWDITDRDCDLFTYALLRTWLWKTWQDENQEHETGDELVLSRRRDTEIVTRAGLAAAVGYARSACKLKSLVGAAPVVWGLPCLSYSVK
ncbi:uncharacterized protein LOC111248630 isoform X2 [Varroa destructor]|uniref:separase n=1 Tax=Varroa destructor TaxID=109461 RepID=A0A7M7JWG2_VARDE|nr:uncharacterized protein LOC111248630 isoform X2 [Varroa destructor]